jgi:hypothetical protein
MQLQNLQQEFDETDICPNCGKWEVLVEVTGWCASCSRGVLPPSCSRCGKPCEEENRSLCYSCKYMVWLETNADRIELTMMELLVDASTAKKLVRESNRPICLCCDEPIKGGKSGKNFFCKKTKPCKTGHNSYHYYKTRGYPDALNRALLAAQRERLIEIAARKTINDKAA